MRKEKLLAFMLFLALVTEHIDNPPAFIKYFWTPASLFDWFTEPRPIKLSILEIVTIILLVTTRIKRPIARPIITAIRVSFATVIFVSLYGVLTGGLVKPLYTQMHSWVFGLLFALTAIAVFSTVDDFRRAANAIVIAALWRSCIAIVCYLKVRGLPWYELPSQMTTHEDSVLFVVGLITLVSRAIEFHNKKAFRYLAIGGPLILAAMKFNNRRLVWPALVASILVVYFILPATSKIAVRINRTMRLLAPIIVIYVAVGWGRPEPIFKPVATFYSMLSTKSPDGSVDRSTRARDNENYGLVVMMLDRPILGTGLGHQWLEIDSSGTVPLSIFPMYRYAPHNSVLALLAFCGGLGVAALWMVIPISVYLNARAYRKSSNPTERAVAITGITATIAYLNQAYGDMGFIHIMPSMLLGLAIATAARLSVVTGAWPSAAKTRPATTSQRPPMTG